MRNLQEGGKGTSVCKGAYVGSLAGTKRVAVQSVGRAQKSEKRSWEEGKTVISRTKEWPRQGS